MNGGCCFEWKEFLISPDECVNITRSVCIINNCAITVEVCVEMKQMLTGVKCVFCSRSRIWCRQTSGVCE